MREQAGLELERFIRPAEVHEFDVVASPRNAILGRKPKISFPCDQRRSWLDDADGKRLRHEVNSDERDVGWFDGQRRGDRLRWKREDGLDRDILDQNVRKARRGAVTGWVIIGSNAEIIAGPTHWIEHRLRGIQEAKPIRPPVVVRAAVSILLGDLQPVRRVVGEPGTTFVFTILGDK